MKLNQLFKRRMAEQKPKKSKTREWVDAIVFALVASTIIRGLLFSAYAIPSGSMEGTEMTGDYLFVSKLHYGPRMAITPVSVPFMEPRLSGSNIKTYWDGLQLPYFRLPGFSQIKNGDVVVFNKPVDPDNGPMDMKTCLIKRCQAIPGDVLAIVNTQVYINGMPLKNALKAQTSYLVTTDGNNINPQTIEDLHVEVYQQTAQNTYMMIIPANSYKIFAALSGIKSVRPIVEPAGIYDPQIYPHDAAFKWNLDNFGPLQMPKPGLTIPLNDSTTALYREVITNYEHNTLEKKGQDFYINGKKTNTYVFKNGYYWMMGDNRHNSLDSRYWGMVPQQNIIGKAMFTWMSIDSSASLMNKIRWDRLFRKIE